MVNQLRTQWIALWNRVGAQGKPRRVYDHLAGLYGDPERRYHTLAHVNHCLCEFAPVRHLAHDPDAVELAIWFHDAIYVPRLTTSERASAEWMRRILRLARVNAARIMRVEALILATTHREPPADPDAQLLCDIDLAILGQSQEHFDAYDVGIRNEYRFVPEDRYRARRAEVLARLRDRKPRLYLTNHFHERYGAPAEANLTRAIAALQAPPA